MRSGLGERYDFFLSRRGSVAAIAREVTDVLTEKSYRVFVQDYDVPLAANFIEEMHEVIKNARDLVVCPSVSCAVPQMARSRVPSPMCRLIDHLVGGPLLCALLHGGRVCYGLVIGWFAGWMAKRGRASR
jgi:hypothetical protein